MSKMKKIFLIFLLLLIMIVSFSVVIQFQDVVSLPVYFNEMTDYQVVGQYVPLVLFSLSLFLIAVSVLLIFFILISPGKKSRLTFKGQNGELSIEKKSIENFVLCSVQKENFIDDPKVKVTLTKRKVSVLVRGNLHEQYHIPDEYQNYSEQLEKQLESLLGTDKEKKIHILIRIQNYYQKQQEPVKSTKRVQ